MAVIHHFAGDNNNLDWEDVSVRDYGSQPPKVVGATRRILIGTDEAAESFHMRYFEVQPGGYTSLDQHAHDHGVMIMRGTARLCLGDDQSETHELTYGDVIYIPGNERHQFFCVGEEPMGFLCVVPAKR